MQIGTSGRAERTGDGGNLKQRAGAAVLTALVRPRRRPAEQAEHCAGTAALAAAPVQLMPEAQNLPPAGHSQLN